MPEELNAALPRAWIAKEVWEKARSYVKNFQKKMYMKDVSRNNLLIYVASNSKVLERKYILKDVDESAVRRYEATLMGTLPRGVRLENFSKLSSIGLSLCKVYVSKNPEAEVIACQANPLNLMCLGCPAFHHRGICAHVLAATHMHYACLQIEEEEKPKMYNLYYLCAKLYGETGERKQGRPKKPGSALEKDKEVNADKEDQLNQFRNNWWGA